MIYGPYKCRSASKKMTKKQKKIWEYHYTARWKKRSAPLWAIMLFSLLVLCLMVLLCCVLR